MNAAVTVTLALARIILLLPVLVLAVALVPAMVVLPVLPAARGRRVLELARHLRRWHVEVVERVTAIPNPANTAPTETAGQPSTLRIDRPAVGEGEEGAPGGSQ